MIKKYNSNNTNLKINFAFSFFIKCEINNIAHGIENSNEKFLNNINVINDIRVSKIANIFLITFSLFLNNIII
jgi:hypothetical protein